MKISFIGYKNSIDYNKIGGTDAFIRRIANILKTDHKIYILTYGHALAEKQKLANNIVKLNFVSFRSLLSYIRKEKIYSNTCIYLKPKDRIKLYFYSKTLRKATFHTVISVYHESKFKRRALFIESLFTYNGHIFCLSKRIFQSINRFTNKSSLIYPPVDNSFFKDKNIENPRKTFNIAYMGRLDWGKGADIAYTYFEQSKLDRNEFSFFMYSYPWKDDQFSLELHNELTKSTSVNYVESELSNHTPEKDENLNKIIDNIDLFILPYRIMSSTIDTPLVPLELLAKGKPYILSNINGLEDLSTKNDFDIKLSTDELAGLLDEKIISFRDNYKPHTFKPKIKPEEFTSLRTSTVFLSTIKKYNTPPSAKSTIKNHLK